MKVLKSIIAICLMTFVAQSAQAETQFKNHNQMISVSSSFFDFSSVSEVDKRRFRSVRRSKVRAALKNLRGRGR